MIHQPSGGAGGQTSDILVNYHLILEMKKELYEILSQHTGQTVERIEIDCDRDYWMKSFEAKEYGLIDEVLIRQK